MKISDVVFISVDDTHNIWRMRLKYNYVTNICLGFVLLYSYINHFISIVKIASIDIFLGI